MSPRSALAWAIRHFRLLEAAGMLLVLIGLTMELSGLRGRDALKQDYQLRLSIQMLRYDISTAVFSATQEVGDLDACTAGIETRLRTLEHFSEELVRFRERIELSPSRNLDTLNQQLSSRTTTTSDRCIELATVEVPALAEQLRSESKLAFSQLDADRTKISRRYKLLLVIGSFLLVLGKCLNWYSDIVAPKRAQQKDKSANASTR